LTKYADRHEGESAFAHIGLYLPWLIRHDMIKPEFFADEDVAEVKAGTMTGSDLQSDVDSKLFSRDYLVRRSGRSFDSKPVLSGCGCQASVISQEASEFRAELQSRREMDRVERP
jgi:hypothetical protein